MTTATRTAYLGLALGIAWSIPYAGILMFATQTPGMNPYEHAADYWLSGGGIPAAIAPLLILSALHDLMPDTGRQRRLWGLAIVWVSLLIFLALMVESVITGRDISWGPMYIVTTLTSSIGHGFFVAGSWHTGWLPRPLLAVWPVAWFVGVPAATAFTPLLLGVVYVLVGVALKRATAPAAHGLEATTPSSRPRRG